MDAIQYLKTKKRMTDSCLIDCASCELDSLNNHRDLTCEEFEFEYPREAVEKVKKWGEKHPLKTRSQVFYKKFPNAPKYRDGVPVFCAYYCGLVDDCKGNCDMSRREKCWNEIAPDEYQ